MPEAESTEPERREPVGDPGQVDPGADTIDSGGTPPPPKPVSTHSRESRRSAPLRCQEFGEYRIIEEVARGAMGIVYRAEQKRLGRQVALKVLLTGEHASEGEVRRFTREAQALARLRHPNIVPIHDIGEVDGRHFFTMDFVEGQTLSQVLLERRLTVTEALHIVEQVADAVAAAHTRGVIHRDIKPSNIMLDRDGGVRIMDFGLAKSAGTETKHTRDGTTIGTPSYMPPEQARGELSRVDERSDTYSIGAVLYEMLAGRPPFGGTNLLEIVLAVINEEPRRPRTVNPRLPRDLETIIVKCMEKAPERRYQTAAELRDEIRRYVGGEPIRAQPPSLLYRAGKKFRKHRTSVAMAGVILALAAAAAGVIGYLLTREVEVTQAKWQILDKCDFSPEQTAAVWSSAPAYFDHFLAPLSGETKHVRAPQPALVSRKISYGSTRATLTFGLAGPLGEAPLALGFLADRIGVTPQERTACFFRISPGRVQLFAHVSPDDSAVPRVVADRALPELRTGTAYRATAERLGLTLRFLLEEAEGADGFVKVAELTYAHPHLTNYRYRNLNVALRHDEAVVPAGLTIERLFLPRQTSALVGADQMFHRGDYNGAFDEYSIIASPVGADGRPFKAAEQAAANFRLGLYYEIKNDPESARRHYQDVLDLTAGPGGEETAATLRAEALLRQVAVCGRTAPAKIPGLLGELGRLSEAQLGGAWMWDLLDVAQHLASRRPGPGQPDLARELAARLSPPAASALTGLRLEAVARASDARGLEQILEQWLPRLGETPVPILGWAELCAAAGDSADCARLFRQAASRLGPGQTELVYWAGQACDAFARRQDFRGVRGVIEAAGYVNLKGHLLRALEGAAAQAQTRNQALELLRFAARHKEWSADAEVAGRAVQLAEAFCAEGQYHRLQDVRNAYGTPALAGVYLQAIEALHRAGNSAGVLSLLESARGFAGRHEGLSKLAVRIAEPYAECANPDDQEKLKAVYEAFPVPGHAASFRRAFVNLLNRFQYALAGDLFAYARGHLGPDAGLIDGVRQLLASGPGPEDTAAFMDQLGKVEPALAGRTVRLIAWRLELAGYYLMIGGDRAAGDIYKAAWEEKSETPEARALAAEASLRHGLLLSLLDGIGELREARDRLGRTAQLAAKDSRPAVIARAVMEKDLDRDAFRAEASRLKVPPAEIELVLAANASYHRDVPGRANHLRVAWELVARGDRSMSWPYEILKFKQDAALRSQL